MTPHPWAVSEHSDFMQVCLLHVWIYMFLKQEKSEMDDFEKKTLVLKEKFQYFKKIFLKMSKFVTLAKSLQNVFSYSFVSEHSHTAKR